MLACWLRSLAWLFNSHWHDCSTVADTIVRQLLAWLFNQDNLSCFCVENYFSMVLTVPCTTKTTHNSTNNFRFVSILFSIIALQEKLIFRELFINKCKCDNNIDHDTKTQWNEFLKDLLTLSSVPARRHLLCCMKKNVEFNDFCNICDISNLLWWWWWWWWWWWIVFVIWLFQPGPLSELFTIANLQHTASRISTCTEPEFRLCCMKLCSSDNHCTTAPLCGAIIRCFL